MPGHDRTNAPRAVTLATGNILLDSKERFNALVNLMPSTLLDRLSSTARINLHNPTVGSPRTLVNSLGVLVFFVRGLRKPALASVATQSVLALREMVSVGLTELLLLSTAEFLSLNRSSTLHDLGVSPFTLAIHPSQLARFSGQIGTPLGEDFRALVQSLSLRRDRSPSPQPAKLDLSHLFPSCGPGA